MGSQSRSFQRQDGSAGGCHDPVLYVEIEIGMGGMRRRAGLGVGAGDAGGEDWEASSHVADVLAQIFAWHNAGRGLVSGRR